MNKISEQLWNSPSLTLLAHHPFEREKDERESKRERERAETR